MLRNSFALLVLCVSLFSNVSAQSLQLSLAPPSFTEISTCQDVEYHYTITNNGGSDFNDDLTVDLGASELSIVSLNGETAVDGVFPPTSISIVAGSSSNLTVIVRADCGSIQANSYVDDISLTLSNSGGALANFDHSVTINSPINLFYSQGTSSPSQFAKINDVVIRTYEFTNGSSTAFTGVLRLEEIFKLPLALDVTSMTAQIFDAGGNLLSNLPVLDSDFSDENIHAEFSLTSFTNTQKIIVSETLTVVACNDLTVMNWESDMSFKMGCTGSIESCEFQNETPNILDDQIPKLVMADVTNYLETCTDELQQFTFRITNENLGSLNRQTAKDILVGLNVQDGGLNFIPQNEISAKKYLVDDSPSSEVINLNYRPVTDAQVVISTLSGNSDCEAYRQTIGTTLYASITFDLINVMLAEGEYIDIEYSMYNCCSGNDIGDLGGQKVYSSTKATIWEYKNECENFSQGDYDNNVPAFGAVSSISQRKLVSQEQTYFPEVTMLIGQNQIAFPPTQEIIRIENSTSRIEGFDGVLSQGQFIVELLFDESLFYTEGQIPNTEFGTSPILDPMHMVSLQVNGPSWNSAQNSSGDPAVYSDYLLGNNKPVFSVRTAFFNISDFPSANTSTAEVIEFLSNSMIQFGIAGNCIGGIAQSAFEQRFYYNPNPGCDDCRMFLSKEEGKIDVQCPGCIVPGWNVQNVTSLRTTYGLQDENNDGVVDEGGIQLDASYEGIRTTRGMVGDHLSITMESAFSDGALYPNGVTIAQLQSGLGGLFPVVNLTNNYVRQYITNGNVLDISGFRVDLKLKSGGIIVVEPDFEVENIQDYVKKFRVSLKDVLDANGSGAVFLFDLPLSLFGGVTSFGQVESLTLTADYTISENPGGAPPVLADINCLHFMTTSNFDDLMFSQIEGALRQASAIAPGPDMDSLFNFQMHSYWCESGRGSFELIPIATGTNFSVSNDEKCEKNVNIRYNAYVGLKEEDRYFDNEYRRIAPQFEMNAVVPAGYQAIKYTIGNGGAEPLIEQLLSGSGNVDIMQSVVNHLETGQLADDFFQIDETFVMDVNLTVVPICSELGSPSFRDFEIPSIHVFDFDENKETIIPTLNVPTDNDLTVPEPILVVAIQNPQVQAITEEVCFKFNFSNLSTTDPADFVFIRPTAIDGFNYTRAFFPSGPDLLPVNGTFELGTIVPNTSLPELAICGELDCEELGEFVALDKIPLEVNYGWDCIGYPAGGPTTSVNTCFSGDINYEVSLGTATFETTLIPLPVSDLSTCGVINYELEVISTGQADLEDFIFELDIEKKNGYDFDGSVTIKLDDGETVDFPSSASPLMFTGADFNTFPEFLSSGSSFKMSFDLETNCDYEPEGQNVSMKVGASSVSCVTIDEIDAFADKVPVDVSGDDELAMSPVIDRINTTLANTEIDFNVVNSLTATTQNQNTIKMIVPVTAGAVSVFLQPANTPVTLSAGANGNEYIWSLPQMNASESIDYKISIESSGVDPCNSEVDFEHRAAASCGTLACPDGKLVKKENLQLSDIALTLIECAEGEVAVYSSSVLHAETVEGVSAYSFRVIINGGNPIDIASTSGELDLSTLGLVSGDKFTVAVGVDGGVICDNACSFSLECPSGIDITVKKGICRPYLGRIVRYDFFFDNPSGIELPGVYFVDQQNPQSYHFSPNYTSPPGNSYTIPGGSDGQFVNLGYYLDLIPKNLNPDDCSPADDNGPVCIFEDPGICQPMRIASLDGCIDETFSFHIDNVFAGGCPMSMDDKSVKAARNFKNKPLEVESRLKTHTSIVDINSMDFCFEFDNSVVQNPVISPTGPFEDGVVNYEVNVEEGIIFGSVSFASPVSTFKLGNVELLSFSADIIDVPFFSCQSLIEECDGTIDFNLASGTTLPLPMDPGAINFEGEDEGACGFVDADFNVLGDREVGAELTFQASETDGLHYWTTGDNGDQQLGTNSAATTHVYNRPGSYTVSHVILGPDRSVALIEKEIIISENGNFRPEFDGVNDYIRIPSISGYNLGAGDFTIDISVLSVDSKDQVVLSSVGPSGLNIQVLSDGNVAVSTSGNLLQTTGFDVLDGSCHDLRLTRAGNVLSLNIDNVAVGQISGSTEIVDLSQGIILGAASTIGSSTNFTGTINRFFITQSVLGSNDEFPKEGSLGYWPMNESGEQFVVDHSILGQFGFLGSLEAEEEADPSRVATTCQLIPLTKLENCEAIPSVVSLDEVIKAEKVAVANGYDFRVSTIDNQIIESISRANRNVRLRQFENILDYGQEYIIEVRAIVGTERGEYGDACIVRTVDHPTTQLETVFCNGSVDFEDKVYADAITNAEEYIFEISQAGYLEQVTTAKRWFRFSDLDNLPNFQTSYDVRVASNVIENTSEFGVICQVTLNGQPTTVLELGSCDITLDSINQQLKAEKILGVDQYLFNLYDDQGGFIETLESGNRGFKIVQYDSKISYNTTYQIGVSNVVGTNVSTEGNRCSITVGQFPVGNISNDFCGTILLDTTALIIAKKIFEVDSYEFLVTDVNTLESISVLQNNRNMLLTQAGFSTLENRVFEIKVRGITSTITGAYGDGCEVSIPIGPTKLDLNSCGQVLEMADVIFAIPVDGASSYDFEISNSQTNETLMQSSTTGSFRFIDLASLTFNTIYEVRVRTTIDGVVGEYGEFCQVTLGIQPTTQLDATSCDQNVGINGPIRAIPVGFADGYEYEVVDTQRGLSDIIEFTNANFTFPDLDYQYHFNTSYDVRVRTVIRGSRSEWGTACVISTTNNDLKMLAAFCDLADVGLSDVLRSETVVGASSYTFTLTNFVDYTEEVTRSNSVITLVEFVNRPNFEQSYTLLVQAALGGENNNPGDGCSVILGSHPVTQLRSLNCNSIDVTTNATLVADFVLGAETYLFEVTSQSDPLITDIIVRPNSNFSMAVLSFPRLPGETYDVRVATYVGPNIGDYGPNCTVTIENSNAKVGLDQGTDEFKVVSYPSPFNDIMILEITHDVDMFEVRNALGTLVYFEENVSAGQLILKPNWASGMYFITLKINNQVWHSTANKL